MLAVYQTIETRGRLFVQAPTGIGQTISVVYPAVKAVGTGSVDKMFYLTAKTLGRTVAEKAVNALRRGGLALKSITLTARDKICFVESGQPSCDLERCEYAIGYFDRVGGAIEELFQVDAFTAVAIVETTKNIGSVRSCCPLIWPCGQI